ncbi:MAG TPA: hypothetical protein VFF06_11050 [Polyangia bacterium]|nr:hypothetical protein [Polyangia bacterium]
MARLPLALVLLAACRPPSGPPCAAPIPSTTLYDSYCPSAPQSICFVDHPTDL